MKKIIFILFFIFAPIAEAVEVVFTWQRPVPAFNQTVPVDWVIDEYRIYCNGSLVFTVQGYQTESYTVDVPPDEYTCYITSFSNAVGRESVPSNPVTQLIPAPASPNAPTAFDFIFASG